MIFSFRSPAPFRKFRGWNRSKAHIKPQSSKPGKQLAMEFVQSSKERWKMNFCGSTWIMSRSPWPSGVGIFFKKDFCQKGERWLITCWEIKRRWWKMNMDTLEHIFQPLFFSKNLQSQLEWDRTVGFLWCSFWCHCCPKRCLLALVASGNINIILKVPFKDKSKENPPWSTICAWIHPKVKRSRFFGGCKK